MHDPLPQLHMSDEQLTLLTAQLLVYQHYLQRKVPPSTKQRRGVLVLQALLRRLHALATSRQRPQMLLLTDEEVALIKEALTVLHRRVSEKRPSGERGAHEILRVRYA